MIVDESSKKVTLFQRHESRWTYLIESHRNEAEANYEHRERVRGGRVVWGAEHPDKQGQPAHVTPDDQGWICFAENTESAPRHGTEYCPLSSDVSRSSNEREYAPEEGVQGVE